MAKFNLAENVEQTLTNWLTGLRSLSFTDNFVGYEWTGQIEAGEVKKIPHDLKVIPTRFIVLSCRGSHLLNMDETKADLQFFYIKNRGTTSTFLGRILILP